MSTANAHSGHLMPRASHVPPFSLYLKGNGQLEPLSKEASDYMGSVLDAFPYYVMLIDAEHRILFANTAVAEALGVDPQAILGDYCPRVVHGLDGPYAGCPLEKSRQLDKAVEVEYLDAKTHRVLRSSIFPTPYETAPGCTVYLHTVRDLTEQRNAEREAQRAHEAQRFVNEVLHLSLQDLELEDILNRVTEKMCSIRWLSSNPQASIFLTEAEGMLRLKAERNQQQRPLACREVPFGKCLCGKAAQTRCPQFASHSTHEPFQDEKDDHGHYCLPILHGESVLGVLNIGLDPDHKFCDEELSFLTAIADTLASVIERKRVEALQRQHHSVAVARERMARVGELSAGVAHTIRNPLHGMLSCVDILDDHAKVGDPSPSDIIALMRDGLERIERVTRRLLSLTREGLTERSPTNVGSLLDDLLDFTKIQAEKRGISLALQAEYRGEASLSMDGVVEGLSGVISNALDACEQGKTIVVRSYLSGEEGTTLVLEVQDDGEGISAEDLPRVMDPFFTTKPIGSGSGLGLAITKRVMYDHEGDMEIESRKGEGTLVRLVFPRSV